MKRLLTLALVLQMTALGLTFAVAQPSATYAIRVFLNYVVFDWDAVAACASAGDQTCRIAMEARKQCRR